MLWNKSHGRPGRLWQPSAWQHSNRMETINDKLSLLKNHCKRTALKEPQYSETGVNEPQHQRTAAALRTKICLQEKCMLCCGKDYYNLQKYGRTLFVVRFDLP